MSSEMTRFDGVRRLFGNAENDRIRAAHVCVVGIGGVGSWAVEALARSGVGRLTLVDLDDVCVSNTNRQLHALDGEIGKAKVAVMRERCLKINPSSEIRALQEFFLPETADSILAGPLDYVVDAIDHVAHKALLLARCRAKGIPVVTTGGAGGRRDPSGIRVEDLSRTSHDGLLQKVRKELRAHHGFPEPPVQFGIECVFSTEPLVYPWADGTVCEQREEGTGLRLDCESGFGTASFVTGVFGLIAAGRVVQALARGGGADERSTIRSQNR